MFQVINNSKIIEAPLKHLFNGTIASAVQRDDLLGFHDVGKQYFEDYCKVFITKESTSLPEALNLVNIRKQGTDVAHNIMGGLQIIAMFHL